MDRARAHVMCITLDRFSIEADADLKAAHDVLELPFLSFGHNERSAASRQIVVVLAGVGNRQSEDFSVVTHIPNLGERQNAFGIRQQSLDGHSIQMR
jgi:hypothetical protein